MAGKDQSNLKEILVPHDAVKFSDGMSCHLAQKGLRYIETRKCITCGKRLFKGEWGATHKIVVQGLPISIGYDCLDCHKPTGYFRVLVEDDWSFEKDIDTEDRSHNCDSLLKHTISPFESLKLI